MKLVNAAKLAGALALVATVGCTAPSSDETTEPPPARERQPEATSLFGQPLYPAELFGEARAKLEANLAEAQANYDREPEDPEAVIWLGRRLAYMGRYRDAIEVYSQGIALHPDYFKLYRHRGHRYISVREFDKAIADLEKASQLIEGVPDEVEPDGAPNAANIPRSTSHSNIWYHLGLAYYLIGDFENAAIAYEACMEFSKNDDMVVATADWLYMIYRRLGRDQDAERILELVREEMDILENDSYHQRLLMYKGLVEPEVVLNPADASPMNLATQGYGVGNWFYYNGDVAKAKDIFQQVLSGLSWSAFGYIAAEADLKRMEE